MWETANTSFSPRGDLSGGDPGGSGAVFPLSDGRTAGGLTPTEKPGWNKNTNKHSRPPLAFGAAGSEFWTTSRTRVDKNFRGLPLSRWQPWRILLVFEQAALDQPLCCLLKASPNTRYSLLFLKGGKNRENNKLTIAFRPFVAGTSTGCEGFLILNRQIPSDRFCV